jgi:soluble lytic murein transglycosylase-like protein
MMVAIRPRAGSGDRLPANKTVYICFIVSLLAAFPAFAQSPASPPAGGAKKVVVRADRKTGKLVTGTVTVPAPPTGAPAVDVARMVEESARAHNVDPLLVHSVIEAESNYNPHAVSPKGARGLMQLMPPTARELGVTDSFDPRQNIEAGVRYLKYLQELYHDDRLALAAYNAGPAAVQKYDQRVPPYPETQAYVERVGRRYAEARKTAGSASGAGQAPAPSVTTEQKHPRLERFVDEQGRLHLRTAPR